LLGFSPTSYLLGSVTTLEGKAQKMQLDRDFYNRPTLLVARQLLGKKLVRIEGNQRTAGLITEVEAYRGEEDLACHARAGVTPRTRVMYGSAGYAYVYFTYGIHWLFNCVVEHEGFPAAVLVRSIIPIENIEVIAERRSGRPQAEWTNGPAKICQALNIDGDLNGADLCDPDSEIFIEDGVAIPDSRVTNTPRVGLNTVPEPWKSIPWRFLYTGDAADL
jgi:DNA-3-methyladenine glycosylase